MTCFGVGFIAVRLLLGHLPDQVGGRRVALWSLLVEAIGQSLVWGAPQEAVALAGAFVTGLGCALIYPALGVEALKRVPPASRGSAIGAFAAFLDIAYGVAGPAAGLVAGAFGFAAVHVLGAIAALLGAALVVTGRQEGEVRGQVRGADA
jgi:MFS family permease